MEPLIISLGGSLVNRSKINVSFLKRLRIAFKDKNFIIVVGGGKLAREYQDALKNFNVNNKELDEVGIFATRLNALLVSKILSASFKNFEELNFDSLKKRRKIKIVLGGFKPGVTTDYVTVEIARKLNINFIINMSRVRFIRVKNRPVKRISWEEYKKIIPKKNIPGIHLPFDVEASKLAERNHITIVFENRLSKIKTFEISKLEEYGSILG